MPYLRFITILLTLLISFSCVINKEESSPPYDLRWENRKNSFSCKITVPPNTSGLVYLPVFNKMSIIKESGNICYKKGVTTEGIEGLSYIKSLENSVVFEVASGEYYFEISEF